MRSVSCRAPLLEGDLLREHFHRATGLRAVPRAGARRGFTLVEMLVVIAIVLILLALIVPAFTQLNTARELTRSAYDITNLLDEARAYAKTKGTYTWVGFFEEDASKAAGNPGTGRVVISVVASRDATAMYPAAGDQIALDAANAPDPNNLLQLGRLMKLDNTHLTVLKPEDVPTRDQTTVPAAAYQVGKDDFGSNPSGQDEFGKHVPLADPSAPPDANQVTFGYPIGAATPTSKFVKIIQFNPLGDAAKIVDSPQRLMEIGLRTARGAVVDPASKNCVAIQVTGIGGQVRIYRP